MATLLYRDCPGCGLHLPLSDAPAEERFNSSPECWQIHGELTGYTVMRGDKDFIHQHMVDAYAAQHAGEKMKPIGVAFALIGLYLAFEKGYSGRQVQHMHMLLAQRSKVWPAFTRPGATGALTVQDVMQAEPGSARDDMLRRWAKSVWDAWSYEQARIESLIATVMAD